MKPETRNKIASCKALRNMSVADVVASVPFVNNLGAYLSVQKEDRKQIRASYDAMRKMGGARGFKIPAHVIDHLFELTPEEFAKEYLRVITGTSSRNHAERQYIKQLGQQAYNLTIAEIVVAEFPELKEELFNLKNQN